MTINELTDTTSPGPPGQEERAPWDAAVWLIKEEQDVQPCSDKHETKQVPHVSNESMGEANKFSSFSFPRKVCRMVESDEFTSIWRSKGGKCTAINEDIFKWEVLGKAGQARVFAAKSMRSFIRQLSLYGFIKMQWDFQRSASLPELLAEEAASACSKIEQLLCTSTNWSSCKIRPCNIGDEDGSEWSGFKFLLRSFSGSFELVFLTSRNADKMHFGYSA